jgi:solute carrier family 25 (mitochondrial iron transporter), member 28/37
MEWEERDESVPFFKHCIAGSCAGIMEHMGLYPMDTLKVSN